MVVKRRRTMQGLASAERWAEICPYLLDEGGTWRAVRPSAEHRCTAVSPPVRLRPEKQRRLCLGAAHVDCPTFLAAREIRARALGGVGDVSRVGQRPYPRTAPIVLERPGPASNAMAVVRTSLPQIGLALLMALAAAALVLARFAGP